MDLVISKKVEEAYRIGLIRSESDIQRGVIVNGTILEPKLQVTRAKAAKSLYFMWVLSNGITIKDDLSILDIITTY
jgi:hypothetical protein